MPRFLHAMCGKGDKSRTTKVFGQDDWLEVRLDPDVKNNPDIVGSLLDMANVENDSFDAAIISHSLERLYPHDVGLALSNLHRVLKSDGYLITICSDLQSVCQLVADDKYLEPMYNSPAGPVYPIDVIYGFRPYLAAGELSFASHCGFTTKALTGSLSYAGFVSIWSLRNPTIYTIAALATKQKMEEADISALAQQHFSD